MTDNISKLLIMMIMMAFNVKMMTCLDMISHQSFIKNYIIGFPRFLAERLSKAITNNPCLLKYECKLAKKDNLS